MSRASLLRRYAPLAVVVAVQLVIITLVPSKKPLEVAAGGPGTGDPTQFVDPLAPAGPGTTLPGGSTVDGPGGNGPGESVVTTPGGGTVPDGAVDPDDPTRETPGSTAHCVSGRQANPKVYAYAPQCIPTWSGDNGGATYRGATAKEIKVIVYRGNLGAAVDAILSAQGSDPSDEDFDKFMDAAFGWLNKHYELYGRKFVAKRWNGECPSVPPDYDCLRSEASKIVSQEKPFAFVWNTSLASAMFDQFSDLKVVNLGGWGFRDSFNTLHGPYHWDIEVGGTQMVDMVSEWYCKRMYGGGSAKAVYAGDTSFHARNRVVGAISTDDPENKATLQQFDSMLQQKCGARVAHKYFYAQDITTAEQQKRAAVNKMRESPESTTVMCFCDLVAPLFLYQEQEQQNYYPENVIVATGFMDADNSAQAYGSLSAPGASQKAFDNAFGLAQLPDEEPVSSNQAARIFKEMGVAGTPYPSASRDFEYYAMLGALVQGAGPRLTPDNLALGSSRMLAVAPGGFTNEALNIRSVQPPNDYTWWDSMREVYWSTTKTSEVNGEAGSWISLNGGRWFRKGEFPTGLIKLPAKPR